MSNEVEIIVPSSDEKNVATITHLAGAVFAFIPPFTLFSFIPALIVWLLKKDNSPYISNQAKDALNFQITIAIAMFVSTYILIWIFVGLALIPVILVVNIIFCIIAAVATSKGESYRYPLCLRLIN